MKFEERYLKSRYWTYLNYLEQRCESLADQIERRYKNATCIHTASSCYGMSNYIRVVFDDENGDCLDIFDIRISDHNPTGSGEPVDKYLYIKDRTWSEIKADVFNYISERIGA